MIDQANDHHAAAADIAFRRRALMVNGGIYARRHAPRFMTVLVGTGSFRARYIALTAWLGSEPTWRSADAVSLATLAEEVAKLGLHRPDAAGTCQWHADRLRELVRQYAVLARMEMEHHPSPAWPAAQERPMTGRRRQAPIRTSRRLRA